MKMVLSGVFVLASAGLAFAATDTMVDPVQPKSETTTLASVVTGPELTTIIGKKNEGIPASLPVLREGDAGAGAKLCLDQPGHVACADPRSQT